MLNLHVKKQPVRNNVPQMLNQRQHGQIKEQPMQRLRLDGQMRERQKRSIMQCGDIGSEDWLGYSNIHARRIAERGGELVWLYDGDRYCRAVDG